MKKYLLLSSVSFCAISFAAFAEEQASKAPTNVQISQEEFPSFLEAIDSQDKGKMPKACEDMKLTETQKTTIHAACETVARGNIQDEADLKLAHMDFMDAVMNANGTATDATTAVNKMKAAKEKMMDAKGTLTVNIFFTILTADQRKPAFECMHEMMHKHGHHGEGYGHEHGEHHGDHHAPASQPKP